MYYGNAVPFHNVKRGYDPGFSSRRVEGFQGTCVIQRKLIFQFSHWLGKPGLGHGAFIEIWKGRINENKFLGAPSRANNVVMGIAEKGLP